MTSEPHYLLNQPAYIVPIYCPPLARINLSSYRLILIGGSHGSIMGAVTVGAVVMILKISLMLAICINLFLFANLVSI